ncbi:MAG: hypothetical protein COC19_00185 [SAR86 cluster bacterium]|uniref:Thiamine pyrimidine synthase n=1 Tax=SAR86 cluster bacterium TaxID=2030880 RepID=A0A2A4MWM1_9GAMM|nr:MAG: hypothetical protein COC19_00185 [SAR86 cluster bacterium]
MLSALFSPSLLAQERLDAVTIKLNWQHQFQFAGYYAALEKGFYRELGLAVDIIPGDEQTPCENLLETHFCTATGSLIERRLAGAPLVALASIIQHSPIALATLSSSNMTTPHDLIGKRIESHIGDLAQAEIIAMFLNEAVSDASVEHYNNSPGIEKLINGDIDAALIYTTNEPFLLDQEKIQYTLIHPRSYGIDFYGDVLYTSNEQLRKYPERVRNFREASLKGWRYAFDNQEEIVDLILSKYSTDKSRQHLLAEAKAIEALTLPKLIELGHMNSGRWESMADTLVALNLAKPDYSLDGFIYEPNIPDAYSQMLKGLSIAASLLMILVIAICNSRLSNEINQRKALENELANTKQTALNNASTDELSGLNNRREFFQLGDTAINLSNRHKTPVGIISIDIDDFKTLNDRFGHGIGDETIKILSEILTENTRTTDIHGRIGAEQFAILLPQTSPRSTEMVAQKLRTAIDNIKIEISPTSNANYSYLEFTACFGVSSIRHEVSDSIKTLMRRADEALSEAKKTGPNKVVLN